MTAPILSRNDRGAALTEYGLLVGLVAVLAIGAVFATGERVQYTFCIVTEALQERISGSSSLDCDADILGSGSPGAPGGSGSPPPYVAPDNDLVMTFQGPDARFYLHGIAGGTVIDWGDGSPQVPAAPYNNHTYATSGTYTVRVIGHVDRLGAGGPSCAAASDTLVSVDSFGDFGLESLECAFHGADNLTSVAPLPDTVTTLDYFLSSTTANPTGISSWNTPALTSMVEAFSDNTGFDQPLNSWDVSGVSGGGMARAFMDASAFDQDLDQWDVSGVTTMASMFMRASAFNGDISTWDTGNVTNFSSMFAYANAFDGDLSGWDVSAAVTMDEMFFNNTAFTGGDLSSWDVSRVANMHHMFDGATQFDGDVGGWVLNAGNDMDNMFQDATSFTGTGLGTWDISNVGSNTFTYFLDGAIMFDTDLTSWCNGPSLPGAFWDGNPSVVDPADEPNWGSC